MKSRRLLRFAFPALPGLPGLPGLLAACLGCGGNMASPGDAGGASADDAGVAPPAQFPVGTYTRCAVGTHATGGLLNSIGVGEGSTLAIAKDGADGDALTATYVDENGTSQSFAFVQTTGVTAALAPTAQTASGFTTDCVYGPGDNALKPATLAASAGSMTADGDSVLLALSGTVNGGACSASSPPISAPGTLWLLCQGRMEGAPALTPPATTVPPPQVPVGTYACATQMATYIVAQGLKQSAVTGDRGTLTLTQQGATVTAQYAGDMALSGTMQLTALTATTAIVEASHGAGEAAPAFAAQCLSVNVPSTLETVLVPSVGSLQIDGPALFLSLAGVVGAASACPGAQMAGSLVCTKM